MLVSRPVGVLGKSFGQPALRMSIAFWSRCPQFIQRRPLGLGGLHDLGDALNWPVRRVGGAAPAHFGGALLGGAGARHALASGVDATSRSARAGTCRSAHGGATIGVGTVDAIVDVVVGIGPKVVIGIWPEHIIEKIGVDVKTEHRYDPGDCANTPPPPTR